jgi:DNA modification methylase
MFNVFKSQRIVQIGGNMTNKTIAEQRGYAVKSTVEAKQVASNYLAEFELLKNISFGLPEIDDRYHIWRVPLKSKMEEASTVGEIVINANTSEIDFGRSTVIDLIEKRLLGRKDEYFDKRRKKKEYKISNLRNTIGLGDCIDLMAEMPAESVDLIFTSPPYFNARPQYSEYHEYEEYLSFMRRVIRESGRVLHEGRFMVINVAPILIRRTSRNESSKRIAVPFDLHRIFIEEGFEFVDDLIWVKPEGAGWATGRGRRFFADRNPLQYKAVPVTEYVLVYRKKSELLIDWFIRNHPDQDKVSSSKIGDGYEVTNIWKIHPQTRSKHPAAFPAELATKVISYYSFKGDVVLDPFGGSGTTALMANSLDRRFITFEISEEYMKIIKDSISNIHNLGSNINWINTDRPKPTGLFNGEMND